MPSIDSCIIFGGSGFIGTHFAKHLIDHHLVSKVIIADIIPSKLTTESHYQKFVSYIPCDVRNKVTISGYSGSIDLIANLAAVHREPGHNPSEYFHTNIRGAENVCEFASQQKIAKVIFLSSIAPYGFSEEEKTEESLPTPNTPYGASKLVAEKIHEAWARENSSRCLIIVRPGIVFGLGENGNMTRMVHALRKHYFVYLGNRKTRKAGGYVKELCSSMMWALEQNSHGVFLYNFSFPNSPAIEEYVREICQILKIKAPVVQVPYWFFLGFSYMVHFFSKLIKWKQPIHPVRIQKLVRSNNIKPKVLIDEKYPYQFTLREALEDWLREYTASRNGLTK